MTTDCINKKDLDFLLLFHFPGYGLGEIDIFFHELMDNKISKKVLEESCIYIKNYLKVIEKHIKNPTRVNILKYGLDCFFKIGWNGNDLSESRMKVIFEILKHHYPLKYNHTIKNNPTCTTHNINYTQLIFKSRQKNMHFTQPYDLSLEQSIIKKIVSINMIECIYKI